MSCILGHRRGLEQALLCRMGKKKERKNGVPSMAQWFKSLTAVARVAVEVQV